MSKDYGKSVVSLIASINADHEKERESLQKRINELEKKLKLATDRTPKNIIHTEVVFGGTKATKSNASNSCFKIE